MDYRLLVSPHITIKVALKLMDETAHKTLFVIKERKLVGCISDGDIRRAILKEIKLNQPISLVMNTKPTFATEGYNIEKIKSLFVKKRFEAIPVIDNYGIIKEILYWNEIYSEEFEKYPKLSNPVIIMAGGKGTRLEPFTNILPKPLIPVGDKTMIETIIDEYLKYSINQFYISVYHKSKIIKAYFEEINHPYQVSYIEEEAPMGTAGSLKLVEDKFDEPVFISNCDIMIKEDYSKILDFHINANYDITVVASMQHYQIPYGVCELNSDGSLSQINEKPEYDMLVNTGMYIINPQVFKLIPSDTFYHITQLIESTLKLNKKVGVYPVSEKSWIDVGQWNEFNKNKSFFK